MAKAVPMWIIGSQICEALGLEANRITSLTLRINRNEGAIFELEGVLTDQDGTELETVMTQYRLVPRDIIDAAKDDEEVNSDG